MDLSQDRWRRHIEANQSRRVVIKTRVDENERKNRERIETVRQKRVLLHLRVFDLLQRFDLVCQICNGQLAFLEKCDSIVQHGRLLTRASFNPLRMFCDIEAQQARLSDLEFESADCRWDEDVGSLCSAPNVLRCSVACIFESAQSKRLLAAQSACRHVHLGAAKLDLLPSFDKNVRSPLPTSSGLLAGRCGLIVTCGGGDGGGGATSTQNLPEQVPRPLVGGSLAPGTLKMTAGATVSTGEEGRELLVLPVLLLLPLAELIAADVGVAGICGGIV